MKTPILLLLTVAICFSGCAHRAKLYTAPDHQRLTEASGRLKTAVIEAKASSRRVAAAVTTTKAAHAKEVAGLQSIEPKLVAVIKVAPLELQPHLAEIATELATLRTDQAATDLRLRDLDSAQEQQAAIVARADIAAGEVETLTPEYYARVDELTAKLNAAEAAWEKDSKEIVSLRTGSIIFKIAAGLGLLALAGLAFLWFTGRIAAKAAPFMLILCAALMTGCTMETNAQEKARKQQEWKAQGFYLGEGEADSMGNL